MKKSIVILSLVLVSMLSACKPEEKKIHTGSVMVYSTLSNDELKSIKLEFENMYRGITLDYYYSSEDRIKTLLANEFQSGRFDADVVLGFDLDTFKSFKEMGYLESYKQKEKGKIKSAYRDKENYYIGIFKCMKEDSSGTIIPAGLLKDAASMENGKLFMDFMISKKCKEMFAKGDYISLRK